MMQSPTEYLPRLSQELGIELYAQRDDVLPFPLAGNKVRKLAAEFESYAALPDLVVTNGAIDSNHCRTTAFMAAHKGIAAHLVLHGDGSDPSAGTALSMLESLGATVSIVEPQQIRTSIEEVAATARGDGKSVEVISGGCHTPAGAIAYAAVGRSVFEDLKPDYVFVASGTGATHGGLAAAAAGVDRPPRVVGVSVARTQERGTKPVLEAAAWTGTSDVQVEFDDRFRAGGYGLVDDTTASAVRLGWSCGLPLDGTYTGKAFAALLAYRREDVPTGARVLFWHTGGMWNHISRLTRSGNHG